MILYKYRGLSNFEYAIDIFINQRLFAASFKSLNDPMEGRFVYSSINYDKYKIREIISAKTEYGIVALSRNHRNHLLWSYYAESHSGFAVGVEILPDTGVIIKGVNYVDDFDLDLIQGDYAESILFRKHKIWRHEDEYRVLKNTNYCNNNFVNVKVKELIFGAHSNDKERIKKKLLTKIARKFCPEISIKDISEEEIENGILSDT